MKGRSGGKGVADGRQRTGMHGSVWEGGMCSLNFSCLASTVIRHNFTASDSKVRLAALLK